MNAIVALEVSSRLGADLCHSALQSSLQASHEGLMDATAGCLRLLRHSRLYSLECLARASLIQVT